MQPKLSSRIAQLSGSVARDILSRCQNRDIVSFAGGLPDASLWNDLELPQITSPAFQYGPSEGDLPLRQLLSDRAASYGLATSPETTLVTSGSQQGLDLAAKLLIDPQTPIVTETPTYLAALQVFQLFQAKIHSLPLSSEGIDPESLDETLRLHQPRLVYLNPSYQNPTGFCYSLERRQQLAAVLDSHSAVLLEDEPYRELAYDSPTPPPISSFLEKAPWIHLSSVSKILIPGLRLGSLTCSPELFPHLLKLKQAADLHSSRIAQYLAAQLLADSDRQLLRLQRTLSRYREKRDAMQRVLETHFSHLATWQIPTGGMFFWLKLRQPTNLAAVLEKALAQNIAFMPGTPFFASPDSAPATLRLNFTLPTLSQILSHLPLLARLLAS